MDLPIPLLALHTLWTQHRWMEDLIMTITVMKNVEKTVLLALKASAIRRQEGKAEEIVIIGDHKKPILRITPQGDIEEILCSPLKVSMLDHVAENAINGDHSQQQRALSFARLILNTKGSLS